MTKLSTIAMVVAMATSLSTLATPVATHPTCADQRWLLIELDSTGKEVQSQCVENPQCPQSTEIVEVNMGSGGDYIVCRPCGADCNREFP
jgi:hypothetical protein